MAILVRTTLLCNEIEAPTFGEVYAQPVAHMFSIQR